MDPVGAWTTICVCLVVLAWGWFGRRSVPAQRARDVASALGGAGIALGGLLLLDEVDPASWIVAPVIVGAALVVHRRFLFAGEGPFRT